MGTMASQITSLRSVYSILYSEADQRKHHSSAWLAFVQGIHRSLVNSPHKRPVTWKMFPFDDIIMNLISHIIMDAITYPHWSWSWIMLNGALSDVTWHHRTWLLSDGAKPLPGPVLTWAHGNKLMWNFDTKNGGMGYRIFRFQQYFPVTMFNFLEPLQYFCCTLE